MLCILSKKTEKIFVTGAADFLGGSVATQLIKQGVGGQLCFLIDAISPGQGLKILRYNLRAHGVGEFSLAELKSHQILCGSFYDMAWLENESSVLMSVSRVINCAIAPAFSNDSKVQATNADGVYEFAKFMSRSWRLQRFLHVGSALSDSFGGKFPIAESWTLNPYVHLANYNSSHLEIDKRITEELGDLPLVVARRSTVLGHTVLGCQTSGSVFWIFRLAFALKKFTWSLGDRIDIIPVDYCANALIVLACKNNLKHDLYHISVGVDSSCTFADVYRSFAAACISKETLEGYEKVKVDVIEKLAVRFEAHIGSGNPRLIMKSIRIACDFASFNSAFENSRLLNEGVSAPPKFTAYLASCLKSSKELSITHQMQSDHNCW